MKNTLFGLFIILLLISCTGSEFKELKDLQNNSNKVTETFIKAMEDAGSGKKAAEAISGYLKGMRLLENDIIKLADKNPELLSIYNNISEPPEELIRVYNKRDELSRQFFDTLRKLTLYLDDPKVVKEYEMLNTFMGNQ